MIVAESLEGETPESDHFVKKNSVRPNVGHGREQAVGQALRGHPPDRQHSFPAESIVVVFVHRSENEKAKSVLIKGSFREIFDH